MRTVISALAETATATATAAAAPASRVRAPLVPEPFGPSPYYYQPTNPIPSVRWLAHMDFMMFQTLVMNLKIPVPTIRYGLTPSRSSEDEDPLHLYLAHHLNIGQ